MSGYKPQRPFNEVHQIPLRVIRWKRGLPRLARFEATAYNSGYGIGFVTAMTREGCEQKLDNLIGKMVGESW